MSNCSILTKIRYKKLDNNKSNAMDSFNYSIRDLLSCEKINKPFFITRKSDTSNQIVKLDKNYKSNYSNKFEYIYKAKFNFSLSLIRAQFESSLESAKLSLTKSEHDELIKLYRENKNAINLRQREIHNIIVFEEFLNTCYIEFLEKFIYRIISENKTSVQDLNKMLNLIETLNINSGCITNNINNINFNLSNTNIKVDSNTPRLNYEDPGYEINTNNNNSNQLNVSNNACMNIINCLKVNPNINQEHNSDQESIFSNNSFRSLTDSNFPSNNINKDLNKKDITVSKNNKILINSGSNFELATKITANYLQKYFKLDCLNLESNINFNCLKEAEITLLNSLIKQYYFKINATKNILDPYYSENNNLSSLFCLIENTIQNIILKTSSMERLLFLLFKSESEFITNLSLTSSANTNIKNYLTRDLVTLHNHDYEFIKNEERRQSPRANYKTPLLILSSMVSIKSNTFPILNDKLLFEFKKFKDTCTEVVFTKQLNEFDCSKEYQNEDLLLFSPDQSNKCNTEIHSDAYLDMNSIFK